MADDDVLGHELALLPSVHTPDVQDIAATEQQPFNIITIIAPSLLPSLSFTPRPTQSQRAESSLWYPPVLQSLLLCLGAHSYACMFKHEHSMRNNDAAGCFVCAGY